MGATVIADRVHFAALIMFHYLFPPVTIGLAWLIAALKGLQLRAGEGLDGRYARAARFWGRLFLLNYGAGVATGVPMEFQFGTNWAHFSSVAGGVIGLGLMLEGTVAFFLESAFLAIFLFGERRVTPRVHALSAVLIATGSTLSALFITAADAWMQHPVAYAVMPDGRYRLTSFWAFLNNPFERWEFLHAVNGGLVHGAILMSALGAFYLLARRHREFARISLTVGLVAGLVFSLTQVFPTGSKNGEAVVKYEPTTLAAMEGQFKTEQGAPLAVIGMPDTVRGDLWPPVEVTYYAYHIMIILGGYFIALTGAGLFLLWRGWLFEERWRGFLWLLMLSVPFPYIANEAGWVVTCVGRQPWVIYGLLRTAQGISPNVSAGEVVFTLLGFAGLYILLGLLFVVLLLRFIAEGPEEAGETHTDAPERRVEVPA